MMIDRRQMISGATNARYARYSYLRYQQTAGDVSVPEVRPNNGPPAPVEHLLTTVDIWRRGCVTKQQPSLANTRETQLRHSTWPIQLCQSSGTGGGRGRNNAPPNQRREILAGQIYLSGRIRGVYTSRKSFGVIN